MHISCLTPFSRSHATHRCSPLSPAINGWSQHCPDVHKGPTPPRCSEMVPRFPRRSQAPPDSCQPILSKSSHKVDLSEPLLGRIWVQGAEVRGQAGGGGGQGAGLTSPPGSPRWPSCSGLRPCTGSGRSPRVCSAEVHSPPGTGCPGGRELGLRAGYSESHAPPPTSSETRASKPTPTLNGVGPSFTFRLFPGPQIPSVPRPSLCIYCSLCLCLVNSSPLEAGSGKEQEVRECLLND